MKTILTPILLLLVLTTLLPAAQFNGTVRSVRGDVVTVAMEGDVMPPIGAKAEIYFKLAGSNDEVSVATGRALQIASGDLLVKIENASGSVAKDQRVRFTTAAAQVTPAGKNSIVGEWVIRQGKTHLGFQRGRHYFVDGRSSGQPTSKGECQISC